MKLLLSLHSFLWQEIGFQTAYMSWYSNAQRQSNVDLIKLSTLILHAYQLHRSWFIDKANTTLLWLKFAFSGCAFIALAWIRIHFINAFYSFLCVEHVFISLTQEVGREWKYDNLPVPWTLYKIRSERNCSSYVGKFALCELLGSNPNITTILNMNPTDGCVIIVPDLLCHTK